VQASGLQPFISFPFPPATPCPLGWVATAHRAAPENPARFEQTRTRPKTQPVIQRALAFFSFSFRAVTAIHDPIFWAPLKVSILYFICDCLGRFVFVLLEWSLALYRKESTGFSSWALCLATHCLAIESGGERSRRTIVGARCLLIFRRAIAL